MLYTSENSSLAYLENLVHFDSAIIPPHLYIMTLEIEIFTDLVYTLPDSKYPKNWMHIGQLGNKILGDKLMNDRQYLAIKVRSAVNFREFNYLLNPLYPAYHKLVKVVAVEALPLDNRLISIKTVNGG